MSAATATPTILSGCKVLAFQWMPDGAVQSLAPADAIGNLHRPDGSLWIRVVVMDVTGARHLLSHEFEFHELFVEDALSTLERPSFQDIQPTVFFSVSAAHSGDQDCQFTDVSFFLREHALVTVELAQTEVLDSIQQRLTRNGREIGSSTALMVHSMLDAIVDSYFPLVDAIEDRVETLEESVYGGNRQALIEAVELKRNLLTMRRTITPVRDVVNSMLRHDVECIPLSVKPYFQDIYDHLFRVLESVDLNRDLLATIVDAQLNWTSNELNDIMKRLTIFATWLMTLALLPGVYGMNVKNIPMADRADAWLWIGAVSIGLCAWEWLYFRKRGWL